jgi:hypothetical protein
MNFSQWWPFVTIGCLSLVSALPIAAQDQVPNSPQAWARALREHFKGYQGIFQIDVDAPTAEKKQTSFHISGDLIPTTATGADADPRTVARAFLTENAEALGISSNEEIRDGWFGSSPSGWTTLNYRLYISGLPIDGAGLALTEDENHHIRSLAGDWQPIPPELETAVKTPTLTEEQIRGVVLNDLASSGIVPRAALKPEKFAVRDPPYVVWKVEGGGWSYTIDAFNGTILRKRSTARS